MRNVFVPAIGQFDNIGDLMLRRPLLDRLRMSGRLHVYTGAAPPGYLAGLRLEPGDTVYRSFSEWHRALLASARRGEADYAFKPGEIQLTPRGMKEHLGLLPALTLTRSTGGRVIRIGSGARSFPKGGRALISPSLPLAHVTRWRDEQTAAILGRGGAMPDLAFATEPTGSSQQRNRLVVSLRGDRPAPSSNWVDTVAALARRRGLGLLVVSQVARDDERTRELASYWGADSLPWDGVDHVAQEEALRAAYRSAAITASDRLHVLIAATTEGSQPVAPLPAPASKIDRHFRAAGLPAVSMTVSDTDASTAVAELELLLERSAVSERSLARARSAIDDVFRSAWATSEATS